MVTRKVRILKALSDETRFKIVSFLLNEKKSVSSIVEEVQKAQPTVSLHLRVLELSGVVEPEKDGRKTFYRVTNKQVQEIMKVLSNE